MNTSLLGISFSVVISRRVPVRPDTEIYCHGRNGVGPPNYSDITQAMYVSIVRGHDCVLIQCESTISAVSFLMPPYILVQSHFYCFGYCWRAQYLDCQVSLVMCQIYVFRNHHMLKREFSEFSQSGKFHLDNYTSTNYAYL